MRLVLLADTHKFHREVIVPSCDILIHAGDISNVGELNQVYDFINWFHNQDATYKVWIAGNHDFSLQDTHRKNKILQALSQHEDVIYLENSGVTIEGIKIWGSPWTPAFCDWAFNATTQELREIWAQIPEDTDILISHGPPYGYGDKLENGERVGDKELLARIYEIKPKIVVCGHIHCGYGHYYLSDTTTVFNAAVVNEQYYVVNDPTVINYEDFI
jgi:Icc-related predicted phosphoesterase